MKRYKLIIALLVLVLIQVKANGKTGSRKNNADSIQLYLTQALNLMKSRSVNRHKLDWDKIYKEAYLAGMQARNIRDTYPIIRSTLGKLEDQHSKFFAPETVRAYLLGYRGTGQKFPEIKVTLLQNQYAYITLPPFYSFNFDEWDEFANTFRQKIAALELKHPKGWIIDLRDNDGGMFMPMYAAIAPLLDRNKVIGWKDGLGKHNFIKFKNGAIYENSKVVHRFKLECNEIKVAKAPIVILINQYTASSGEFAAIAFAGQKNVVFVGTKTNGLTSANQEHTLPDGAFLVLTEGNTIDRNKKEYAEIGRGLLPDYPMKNTGTQNSQEDLFLKKALEIIDKT